jgi:DNA repair and recombination protein RAD52
MSFTDDQIKALEAPLNKANVREREQAGRKFSYVEAWHAIAEANRIFGFHAWDRTTQEMRMLSEREQDGKWRVAYFAKVRVEVFTEELNKVVREGCGYGSGIDRDLGQAHESAIKEAESDAMKRALMTFGNPFGLALYDKTQANVDDGSQQRSPGMVSACNVAIGLCKDVQALKAWLLENKAAIELMHPEDRDEITRLWNAKKHSLSVMKEAA